MVPAQTKVGRLRSNPEAKMLSFRGLFDTEENDELIELLISMAMITAVDAGMSQRIVPPGKEVKVQAVAL
jgi:hypothetical protein